MKKIITSFLLVIFAFLLTACSLQASSEPRTVTTTVTTCKLNLQVFVRQGPNANHGLNGQFLLKNNQNQQNGDLIELDGKTPHPISIVMEGQALHFIVETSQGRIYGTGMMDNDIYTCSGNGGGTQAGPALGDLGDWRAEWASETHTNTIQVQSKPFSWFDFIWERVPFVIIAAFVLITIAARIIWLSRPFRKLRETPNTTMQKVEVNPAHNNHIAEYLVTYTTDDKLFDLSFQIEKGTQYFGECGVTVAKTLDTKSTKVTAFEVWVFDKGSSQTVSSILMSDFCNSQETLRNEMQQKGQASVIHAGESITLQTAGLKVNAKILEMEYLPNMPYPNCVFKKVVIKLDVLKI